MLETTPPRSKRIVKEGGLYKRGHVRKVGLRCSRAPPRGDA